MKCRYCADNLRTANEKLFSSIGEKCAANPKGFHALVPDGEHCAYCGNAVQCRAGKPFTKYGSDCAHSPTGLHCLV